jgi:SPP1 gp7 family putative phage head morphogenesis protein
MMEKKSNNYWFERTAKTQARLTEKNVLQTEKQLKKYYSQSMEKIIGQFEKTYNKVLSSIAEGREPTPADLYKLDAYWKMQGQLKEELQKMGEYQMVLFSEQFTQQYMSIYESFALQGQVAYTTIDTATAQQMINHIWCADGKSWSNRIWTNTDLLQQTLNDGLIECVVTGKKTGDLKKILQERFDVSYNNADSIVRTEMAHIQTQASKQRYLDYGIQEVEVWADKDERRCDVCGKLHQKRYPINAQMPIPAHPRCRCCIVPVIN